MPYRLEATYRGEGRFVVISLDGSDIVFETTGPGRYDTGLLPTVEANSGCWAPTDGLPFEIQAEGPRALTISGADTP